MNKNVYRLCGARCRTLHTCPVWFGLLCFVQQLETTKWFGGKPTITKDGAWSGSTPKWVAAQKLRVNFYFWVSIFFLLRGNFIHPRQPPKSFGPFGPPCKCSKIHVFSHLSVFLAFLAILDPLKKFLGLPKHLRRYQKIISTSIVDIFNQNIQFSALQWFGTKIPLNVESSKLTFYFCSGSQSKQLWALFSLSLSYSQIAPNWGIVKYISSAGRGVCNRLLNHLGISKHLKGLLCQDHLIVCRHFFQYWLLRLRIKIAF